MAGKGKFKIGAEVGYVDNLGSPLVCGAYVRHIITGKDGTITQYGVVKGVDGTNYKLCDNFWAVVEHSEPIDINIGDVESEAEELIGEKEEKTLADFSDDELLNEVLQRNFTVKTLAEHGISTYDIPESEDKYLAEELRRRGYEVKAEKTVVVSL